MTNELLVSLPDTVQTELLDVARQQIDSTGILMKGVQAIGKVSDAAMATLFGLTPQTLQSSIEPIFERLYDVSSSADSVQTIRDLPMATNKIGAALSGSVGGWFGFAGIAPDLLASTTLIFNTIQKVARQHGFDPAEESIRRECLAVFCSGGPDAMDDAASSSFVSSRMLINGQAVSGLISKVSSEFAARLLTKLGSQAVPILGAITGAVVNIAFINHYETAADTHFRMLKLSLLHPELDVPKAYSEAVARVRIDRLPSQSVLKAT